MNFEEYLTGKRIDSHAFRLAEPTLWADWQNQFSQMSPASFTSQKLYLINPIRRKYTLFTETEAGKSVVQPKPVIRPKPKIN